MEFSWSIFAVMLLLGAVQLAVGVVLGRCLPWMTRGNAGLAPWRNGNDMEIDPRRLRFFTDRLSKLVAGVSGDVGDHRNQISEISRELATARDNDPGTLTDSVLRSIARIASINERLQKRLEAAEERLQQQNEQIAAHFTESRTDPLTGLMNRRAFDDALSFQVEQGSRPFALMMIDVDHFKELNDEYGHPVGDQVLCNISGRLENLLAGRGMVARYGGEEFAVIVPAVDAAEAQQIAERLRAAIADVPFSHEQKDLALSVSLGVSMVAPCEDPMAGVKRSDEALYTAKRSGRDCAFFRNEKVCRRIEPAPEPSGLVAGLSGSSSTSAARAATPTSYTMVADDSLDAISADLHRRMIEVAGYAEEPTP